MTTFTLPDLGEGMAEAEIVTWHVSPGIRITADQPLVSVETDKAVVEIPSPHSGTVTKVHAAPGDIVAVGAPLADIDTGTTEDTGAVVGKLARASAVAPESAPESAPEARATPTTAAADVRAAPAVRRLAAQLGVDLAGVTGSGPGGAILSADVRAVAGEPLRGVRRAMARAMTLSGETVVPATLTDHADIRAWDPDENTTLRLVRAICAACAAEPALNVGFDGERRKPHAGVDLAIAVDTPDGLFAPVLRQVDKVPAAQLASKITELRAAVGNRSIAPEALKGATITLSNFGMIGGEHAALVISPPQVAILGAGRIHDAVLAVDGTPVVRRVLPLSLTFDHRAVTGGEAARFMVAARADLARAD
ncbi:MAG: dihydrolipoamide acetyltransferase family protein [Alphaproteobacteria bacterium]